MNSKFRACVTETAFSLTLSKRMLEVLLCLADNIQAVHYGATITTIRALEDRGLVERRPYNGEELDLMDSKAREWVERQEITAPSLTKAGRLVVALLKEAGLAVETNANGSSIFNRLAADEVRLTVQ